LHGFLPLHFLSNRFRPSNMVSHSQTIQSVMNQPLERICPISSSQCCLVAGHDGGDGSHLDRCVLHRRRPLIVMADTLTHGLNVRTHLCLDEVIGHGVYSLIKEWFIPDGCPTPLPPKTMPPFTALTHLAKETSSVEFEAPGGISPGPIGPVNVSPLKLDFSIWIWNYEFSLCWLSWSVTFPTNRLTSLLFFSFYGINKYKDVVKR
jgi:hypothetical protein